MKKLTLTKLPNGFITQVGPWSREGENGTPYMSHVHGRMLVFQPDGFNLGTNQVRLAVDSASSKSAFRIAYGKARQILEGRKVGGVELFVQIPLETEVEGGKLYINLYNLKPIFSQNWELQQQFTLSRRLHEDEETRETWETWEAGRIAGPIGTLP